MATTMQQMRPKTDQTQWSSVFPPETSTEQQSALFVKKLLAVAISSITYLRALFPEKAFGDRCLEDISLKILRDDSACPEACQVVGWIRGCFEALEKKYLREVLVGIYVDPEDEDTVIEQYTFKIAYGDGIGMDIYRNGKQISDIPKAEYSDAETKKQTIRLLRTIILLSQTFSPLPDDVMMTMKLLYYDEVTPPDYNPPGFKECAVDGFTFVEEPTNIKVGNVHTHYHAFKLRIKTTSHDLQPLEGQDCIDLSQAAIDREKQKQEQAALEQEQQLEENNQSMMQDQSISLYDDATDAKISKNTSQAQSPVKLSREDDVIPETAEDETQRSDLQKALDEEMGVVKESQLDTLEDAQEEIQSEVSQEQEQPTKCQCEDPEDDGLMVLCTVCNTWQHGVCYTLLEQDQVPETHYCIVCTKKDDSLICTDPSLMKIDSEMEIKRLCLWRRALCAILDEIHVLAPKLAKHLNISVETATSILKRLESEGFVKSGKAKRFGKVVQKDEIRTRGFNKYFRNLHNDTDADDDQDKENHMDNDINMMADQASNMQLQSKNRDSLLKGVKRKNEEALNQIQYNGDETIQFADSQEDPTNRKRRKTSVTTHSMLL